VCGVHCVSGHERKGFEWWNEVKVAVERKKTAFEVWLQRRLSEAYDEYRER
jgi:hypothetical protein